MQSTLFTKVIVLFMPLCHVMTNCVRESYHLELPRPTYDTLLPLHHYLITFKNEAANIIMLSSGFKNAPISEILVCWTVVASILASITDTKYYFFIHVFPHLWGWGQLWRLFVWQLHYI